MSDNMSDNMSYNMYDYNSIDQFKKFVMNYICQCFSQCISLDEDNIIFNNPPQKICNKIITDTNLTEDFYDKIISNAIEFFIAEDILVRKGVKMYISPDIEGVLKKLTWENIKSLNELNKEIHELLWLLRKLIVDSLLRKILLQLKRKSKIEKTDVKVYSVGSSNLTSDYDITLYGQVDEKVFIINEFSKEFKQLFNDDSSIVFDTNIYGKAYITFDKDPNYTFVENCNTQEDFYYVKNDYSYANSQLVWGLIKYFKDLRQAFDEDTYNGLFYFMDKKIDCEHLKICKKMLIYLKNKDQEVVNYNYLLGIENKFMNIYKNDNKDSLLALTDYISLVNFYGIETYFTRGAFLDTVVNNQMCSKENPAIILNEIDYITSILENSGFFFLHNSKTKYFIRMHDTVKKLIETNQNKYKKLYKSIEYTEMLKLVEKLCVLDNENKCNYNINYCKWVSKDDFDFNKCDKFKIFNIIFKIIYYLLSDYFVDDNTDNDDFYFFNTFVKTENNILPGTPEDYLMNNALSRNSFKDLF